MTDEHMNEKEGQSSSLEEVMEELLVRLVLNCPKEEYQSFERMCFILEEAHWYYLDFFREANPSLPNFSFVNFVKALFKHAKLLTPYIPRIGAAIEQWREYKIRVHVCGVIILNSTLDKVLLVKGWSQRAPWSFPRGKINKDEKTIDCAAREAMEEVGFDVGELIEESDQISLQTVGQPLSLFIIPYVPEHTHFSPKTRKEISAIQWYPVSSLPGYAQHGSITSGEGATTPPDNHTGFFHVAAFVQPLLQWIAVQLRSPSALERKKRTEAIVARLQEEEAAKLSSRAAKSSRPRSLSQKVGQRDLLPLSPSSSSSSSTSSSSSSFRSASSSSITIPPRPKRKPSPLLSFTFQTAPILAAFDAPS